MIGSVLFPIRRVPFISHSIQHKLSLLFLIFSILASVRQNLKLTFVYIFLITTYVEHLNVFFSHLRLSIENSLFRSAILFNWIILFVDVQFYYEFKKLDINKANNSIMNVFCMCLALEKSVFKLRIIFSYMQENLCINLLDLN